MRLYGRRSVRRRVDYRARLKVANRDAIIWEVDEENHYALVKIQGSGETIKAHYPKNWYIQPYWLKPGNAVRVRHRAGNRGYVEIIGEGRAIPTPVEGGTFPTLPNLPNGVLTGLSVTQTFPASLSVIVAAGTYRIDGVVYSFLAESTNNPIMQDPAQITMTSTGPITLGEGEHLVTLDAAPTTPAYARYDILVIGTDGVIDYIKGTAVAITTGPTPPTTPSNHVLLATIFMPYGLTELTNANIGAAWTEPKISYMGISCGCTDCELAWSAITSYPTCVVTLTARDQYGNTRNDANGALVTITMAGTGTFKAAQDADYHSQSTPGYGSMFLSSCSFTYKRDQTANPEISPIFTVQVAGWGVLTCVASILLLPNPA